MIVPKELAEKADRYETLKNETEKLFEELEAWANENGFEDMMVTGFGICEDPSGEEQLDDDEYCDQTMCGEDSGSGTYYYPIEGEGSTMYMWITYCF